MEDEALVLDVVGREDIVEMLTQVRPPAAIHKYLVGQFPSVMGQYDKHACSLTSKRCSPRILHAYVWQGLIARHYGRR